MRRFAKGVSKPDDARLQVGTVFADHMLRDWVANGGTDRAATSEDVQYIERCQAGQPTALRTSPRHERQAAALAGELQFSPEPAAAPMNASRTT